MTTVRLSRDHLLVRLISNNPGDLRWLATPAGRATEGNFLLSGELLDGMSATLGDYDWDASLARVPALSGFVAGQSHSGG